MKTMRMILLLGLMILPALAEEIALPQTSSWPESAVFALWGDQLRILWDDRVAWYTRAPEGEWQLSGLQDHGEDRWFTRAWGGLYEHTAGRFVVGDMAVSLEGGPAGDALFALLDAPDRTGWAVVNTPGATAPLYAGHGPGQERLSGALLSRRICA